ncbi:MAG: DUF4124 domain-containing protein [Myxococcales bacterium]|nr:DUF4124 domain-containing protein [Myxococcales bacterium]
MTKILSVLALLAVAAPAAAQPWRYVDKDGAVNYTSNPYELPVALQAKALKELEEAEARRKAEAERQAAEASAAQAQAIPVGEGLPPPVAAPVILNNDGPGKSKPDPMKAWQARREAAQDQVKAAQDALKAAEKAAALAQRNAYNSPSGPNFAANQQAQDTLKARRAALTSAQAEASRVDKGDPRGYQRR